MLHTILLNDNEQVKKDAEAFGYEYLKQYISKAIGIIKDFNVKNINEDELFKDYYLLKYYTWENTINEIKNKKAIKEYYEREISVINRLNLDEINESMNAILDAYNRKGTIYICGNGGSASTASHFQNDFNKGISEYVDNKFNFYCLNDNVATIMAVANDIGYEEVFRFPLRNKITPNDLFIGISGSGNSKNVVNAAEYAKECGAKVVGITGYTGGKLKELADYKMHVDELDMQIDEDLHMTFDHMMMKIFYNYLTKNEITGENINDKH